MTAWPWGTRRSQGVRRNDVKIAGFDNISAVQQAIREGQILATADQHGDQLAVFGIEYVCSAAGQVTGPGRQKRLR